MAAERIGQGACPLCQAPGASVSVSIRGLACLTCSHCKCQVFARGPESDELVRDRIAAKAPAVAPPAPAVAPKPAPPSLPTLTQKKPPVAVSVASVPETPPRKGFGLLKSW